MIKRNTISLLALIALASTAVANEPYSFAEEEKSVVKFHTDRLYPPEAPAQKKIDFDEHGFVVNGERVFLSGGEMHYSRIPRELWRDRMVRMKQAGFNTLQTYIFWNRHEPREGEFDFAGQEDLDLFLKTAKEVGLYVLVRPGPYSCAEWDHGGLPIWMRFIEGINVRCSDPVYLEKVKAYWNRLLPIIAQNQIHKGGSVIMMQMENEHRWAWGASDVDVLIPYLKLLHTLARDNGIEVPLFFSGLNHGKRPAPVEPLFEGRANPWYTTEFWCGWYSIYGRQPEVVNQDVERTLWAIAARGGSGYGFYMVHGGSNLGGGGDLSGATSYDYGSPIGETGDLRPMYHDSKRFNLFVEAFPHAATAAVAPGESLVANPCGARVTVRKGGEESLLFLDAMDKWDVAVTMKDGETVEVPRFWVEPVVLDAGLAGGVRLRDCTARVLSVIRGAEAATVAIYGEAGDKRRFTIAGPGLKLVSESSAAFEVLESTADAIRIEVTYPGAGPAELAFASENGAVRVLAMTTRLADLTWKSSSGGREYLVVGPSYLREFKEEGTTYRAWYEQPQLDEPVSHILVYAPGAAPAALKADSSEASFSEPAIQEIRMQAAPESEPVFDFSGWITDETLPMLGVDGYIGLFGSYSATVQLPEGGAGNLILESFPTRGYSAVVIVNGISYPNKSSWKANALGFNVQWKPGENHIVMLVSCRGRNKMFNHIGPLLSIEEGKAVANVGTHSIVVTPWSVRGGIAELPEDGWQPVAATQSKPTYYRLRFEGAADGPAAAGTMLRLSTEGLSRGNVWLNGHHLGPYPETIPVEGVWLPDCWIKPGVNEVLILDETGAPFDKVALKAEAAASRAVLKADEVVIATPIKPAPDRHEARLARENEGNLAFRKSGRCYPEGDPVMAVDGELESYWSSKFRPGREPWVLFDLEAMKTVSGCEIVFFKHWNRLMQYRYVVEGSTDRETWQTLSDQSASVSVEQVQKLGFSEPSQAIRYLRIRFVEPATVGGKPWNNVGIVELRLFEADR